MKTAKTLALAAVLAVGAMSLAMAQTTDNNAAASGGAGTHSTSQKTGSAANTHKVMKNKNGYRQ
ncbi:MAG TPA: hypothetical protein VGJ20_35555 [Xanthobacteraceae bacterium]